jgi:hypothetical protein
MFGRPDGLDEPRLTINRRNKNTVHPYSCRLICAYRPTTGYSYSTQANQLEVIMERIQKLFELLAGISAEENARLARAKAIFADNSMDVSTLQIPACWRRKQRVCP